MPKSRIPAASMEEDNEVRHSTYYIDLLLEYAKYYYVNPANYGYKKNNSLWK
jgi:hypothetical protein